MGKTRKTWEDAKKLLDKIWFLLWKDDSLKGWIFSVIFIFIFIKFIFFPILSLVTGTALPMAIVESCSMYHEDNLLSDSNEWWTEHNYKYISFDIMKSMTDDFSFRKGFNKGDILFIIKATPEKLEVGDVIIFNGGRQNPLIHRIVTISEENGEYTFSTMGDNNKGQLSVEQSISEERLVGKAVFKLAPYLGWSKLIFYEGMRSENERGLCEAN
jgi:signal peptidase I